MKVYHVTSNAAATDIDAHGFVDRRGRFLTLVEHEGVWVADSPLTENEGVSTAEIAFEIEIDETSIQDYEWIEDGKPYRP